MGDIGEGTMRCHLQSLNSAFRSYSSYSSCNIRPRGSGNSAMPYARAFPVCSPEEQVRTMIMPFSFRRTPSNPATSCFIPSFHFVLADAIYAWLAGPRAPFGVPSWNPFFALRGTCLSDRMRPEPVVFLRLAFSPQLTASMC